MGTTNTTPEDEVLAAMKAALRLGDRVDAYHNAVSGTTVIVFGGTRATVSIRAFSAVVKDGILPSIGLYTHFKPPP